jgi:hypothetical protein
MGESRLYVILENLLHYARDYAYSPARDDLEIEAAIKRILEEEKNAQKK